MAALTLQTITDQGIALTYVAAAAGGDTAVVGPGCVLHVKNGGGASITVTLATPGTVDGDLAVADRAVTIAAGADAAIALPSSLYADPSDGRAHITYSAVTSVTVAHFRSPVTG